MLEEQPITRYEKAAKNQETDRPPIWFMRQAGRYLPEYQVLRKKHGFQTMIRTPELATEITLQPIDRFGVDAAILFSDILVTAEAMGLHLEYIEKKGPVFRDPVRSQEDIDGLSTDASSLQYVSDAIHCLIPELQKRQVPLIGFAGAPFTVASYMIEGSSSTTLSETKKCLFQNPDAFTSLMTKLTDITVAYLNQQIQAGVQGLQIFDTWANYLSLPDAIQHCITPIQTIISRLNNPQNIPITVFCRGTAPLLPYLSTCGADVLSIDWQTDLQKAREIVPDTIALQGNLDPHLLIAPKPLLRERVETLLTQMHPFKGYIFNLGHGIMPQVEPDTVQFLIDTIHNYTPK